MSKSEDDSTQNCGPRARICWPQIRYGSLCGSDREGSCCPSPTINLHLEIGHVLFIDIVGYSRLLIEEQKKRLNQLTEIVLATAPVREATDEQLVRLPTGDGMALVFHHSAEEPEKMFEWLEHAWTTRDAGVTLLLSDPFLRAY